VSSLSAKELEGNACRWVDACVGANLNPSNVLVASLSAKELEGNACRWVDACVEAKLNPSDVLVASLSAKELEENACRWVDACVGAKHNPSDATISRGYFIEAKPFTNQDHILAELQNMSPGSYLQHMWWLGCDLTTMATEVASHKQDMSEYCLEQKLDQVLECDRVLQDAAVDHYFLEKVITSSVLSESNHESVWKERLILMDSLLASKDGAPPKILGSVAERFENLLIDLIMNNSNFIKNVAYKVVKRSSVQYVAIRSDYLYNNMPAHLTMSKTTINRLTELKKDYVLTNVNVNGWELPDAAGSTQHKATLYHNKCFVNNLSDLVFEKEQVEEKDAVSTRDSATSFLNESSEESDQDLPGASANEKFPESAHIPQRKKLKSR